MNKILFIVLVFLPGFLFSQNKITGQIFDADNNVLEFATIQLLTTDHVLIKNEISDEFGKFEIEEKSGNYILQIAFLENILFEQNINLSSNIDLGEIKTENSIYLDEMIIKIADRPKLKKELGKYVVDNLANLSYTKGKNIADALSLIPIINKEKGSDEISILNRGGATILINGKEVGGNEFAMNMLNSIPASQIKKVEVITNPGSKYSASNRNGIVNVVIKKEEDGALRGSLGTEILQSYYNSQFVNGFLSFTKSKISVTSGIRIADYKSKSKSENRYDYFESDQRMLIENNNKSTNRYIAPYLNFEYRINDNQNLGIQIRTSFADRESNANTANVYSHINDSKIDSIAYAKIERKTPSSTFITNLNYDLKLDTIGSNLEVNLAFLNNKQDTQEHNQFNYASGRMNLFLQNPDINTTVIHFKTNYNKVFKNDDELNVGINYTNSKIDNDFLFQNYEKPQKNNVFNYKDYTLAAYATYEKELSDKWEAELGVRLEHFKSEGKSNQHEHNMSIESTNLFPNLSVLFTPNDDHEFSLDFSSSIFRSQYQHLNPFTSFTSINSYRINNPSLLPSLSYEIGFDYRFFEHFIFSASYGYSKNLFNEFDIVISESEIQTITDNYGNIRDVYLKFIYSNQFFNDVWFLTSNVSFTYDNTKGIYNDLDLGFNSTSFNFKIQNHFTLNKKKNMFLALNYGYGSSDRSILGKMKGMQSFTLELSKSFKDFSISAGGFHFLRGDLKLTEQRETYGFNKINKYYETYYINLSYNFGNRKIKNVQTKESEINKRLL